MALPILSVGVAFLSLLIVQQSHHLSRGVEADVDQETGVTQGFDSTFWGSLHDDKDGEPLGDVIVSFTREGTHPFLLQVHRPFPSSIIASP
ncbi:hypothetical protein INR49_028696, partial [Caranx melampygus]